MVAASGIGGARPMSAGVTTSLPARWRRLGDMLAALSGGGQSWVASSAG